MTAEGHVASDRRKAIPATCALHRGPVGFANLMVNMRHQMIVLDPHVVGCCVISLDEAGARALCDALTEWLQQTGRVPRPRSPAHNQIPEVGTSAENGASGAGLRQAKNGQTGQQHNHDDPNESPSQGH
jgi:hypothetical protein